MKNQGSTFLDLVNRSWERVLFGLVGLACLGFTFLFLCRGQVPAASALFAMSFFSFFYSNLARFRRFKGLGFEAELWEDKQKEAADLIDRLKSVVAVYTREIVLNSPMRGRWSDGENWAKHWALYDELIAQHDNLGQKIDFTDLKTQMDSIFAFDICLPLQRSVAATIDEAKRKAQDQVSKQFGSPVTNVAGYSAAQGQIGSVRSSVDSLFRRAQNENIARAILDVAEHAEAVLSASFSISPQFDPLVLDRLEHMATLLDHRPIVVTQELLSWSNEQGA